MKNLWFKNKTHGYGWTPASWQGWVVMIIYFAIFTYLVVDFLPVTQNVVDKNNIPPALWWYLGKIFFITILLILVARLTGEKPRWQ